MATGVLLFPPGFRATDANGDPINGAKCNVYQAGTSTKVDTYSDSTLSTANTNPVVSNSAGLFGAIYVDPDTSVKVVLTDADDVTLQEFDPWVPPAVGPDAPASEQTTTLTGNQDDFSLTDGVRVLRCNNASALVIRGITGGTAGRTMTIVNVGTSTVKLANQDTNSTAANRIDSPSTSGQIIGAKGSIALEYDDTSDRWRITDVDPGVPISWTPKLGGRTSESGQVYSSQLGRYTQEGTRITVSGALTLSTLGTITGDVLVKDLPFTVANVTGVYGNMVVGFWSGLTSSFVYLALRAEPNTTQAEFRGATAAATSLSNLAQANLSATSQFHFTGTYFAA